MADQWREPLSGRVTAKILLQQPIPVFDQVRKLSRSSADSALYRFRIATLTIRVLPHGRPRIAARQPSENQRGVSAEKGKFSVSRTHMQASMHTQFWMMTMASKYCILVDMYTPSYHTPIRWYPIQYVTGSRLSTVIFPGLIIYFNYSCTQLLTTIVWIAKECNII